jgi:drug/metabolite transporter (DMT)-like permease
MLIPGTLLALAGVFLVLTSGKSASWGALGDTLAENPLAFGLGLVAAVAWALYSNLARRWGGPAADGGVPVFVLASGLVLLLTRLFWTEPGSWNVQAMIEAAIMAVMVAVSYECWDIGMRRGNMTLVTTCSYLIPLLSTLVSSLYLGVVPGTGLWIGCLCIIGGTFVSLGFRRG